MLVEFRGLQGEKLFINPDHVMFVTNAEDEPHAVIILTNGLEIGVVLSPQETAAKLQDTVSTRGKGSRGN